MTTEQIVTQPQEPIDIDVAMARLILLRRECGLPRPLGYDISYAETGYQGISLRVASSEAVFAWADALGVLSSGHVPGEAWLWSWNGWTVRIYAIVKPEVAPSDLDDETASELEQIAGAAPLVSDETIREAERIEDLYRTGVIGSDGVMAS